MNANAKFLEEAKGLENRWASLEGIDKKYSRQAAAVSLECQRLMNEMKFFTLTRDGKAIGQIPTRCAKESQIEEINEFLHKHGILDDTTTVSLTDYITEEPANA